MKVKWYRYVWQWSTCLHWWYVQSSIISCWTPITLFWLGNLTFRSVPIQLHLGPYEGYDFGYSALSELHPVRNNLASMQIYNHCTITLLWTKICPQLYIPTTNQLLNCACLSAIQLYTIPGNYISVTLTTHNSAVIDINYSAYFSDSTLVKEDLLMSEINCQETSTGISLWS